MEYSLFWVDLNEIASNDDDDEDDDDDDDDDNHDDDDCQKNLNVLQCSEVALFRWENRRFKMAIHFCFLCNRNYREKSQWSLR